ncbi:DUF2914 domain-containing protein [Geoalkalibacter halelectricus]|uniref:DUF2914 domain-containing protein n=1 Tax=Geoalkalibacter halelectricus TaxID=2847045 RepID=A0ABY5ZTU0_9BACT|nr:DUF2914 domain-containing protein [Geoalkalibacter halelectricus]MDO3376708.1 DUF2914 domain-containing protein [Geoalkalibacter halelectricus]UWZ81340.1 DUF2914 domain-containing protein [Geoalkalibacter halelectricus]
MLKKAVFILLVLLLWSSSVYAQQLEVDEGVVTTGIVDRVPVDAVESYSAEVGRLYFFTRIVGAAEETSVTHVWFFDDEEVARVTLPVRSSNWRTWSSKNILPEWVGTWRVEVVDAEGYVLKDVKFSLF